MHATSCQACRSRGVINGDNVNDLQDALKHAQQYFVPGGSATPRMQPLLPRRPLSVIARTERKATASKDFGERRPRYGSPKSFRRRLEVECEERRTAVRERSST